MSSSESVLPSSATDSAGSNIYAAFLTRAKTPSKPRRSALWKEVEQTTAQLLESKTAEQSAVVVGFLDVYFAASSRWANDSELRSRRFGTVRALSAQFREAFALPAITEWVRRMVCPIEAVSLLHVETIPQGRDM